MTAIRRPIATALEGRCRRASAALAWAVLLLSVWVTACAPQRELITEDADAGRSVALLKGTERPATPPAPNFATLSPLALEASLARIIVRPGTWSRISLGEPATLLSAEQLAWARDALAPRVPRLEPEQRLELRFKSRFHGHENRVEVYTEGDYLVYRFTRLMAAPPDPARLTTDLPPPYGEVVPQPGQEYTFDSAAYYLRDRVFGRGDTAQLLAEKLALVQRAQEAKRATESQLAPVRELLREQPEISQPALARFLDKLELLNKAREGGLFSESEALQRERALLDELAGR